MESLRPRLKGFVHKPCGLSRGGSWTNSTACVIFWTCGFRQATGWSDSRAFGVAATASG